MTAPAYTDRWEGRRYRKPSQSHAALQHMRYPSRGIFNLSRRLTSATASTCALVFSVDWGLRQPGLDGDRFPR
jgi:hypothetical protein